MGPQNVATLPKTLLLITMTSDVSSETLIITMTSDVSSETKHECEGTMPTQQTGMSLEKWKIETFFDANSRPKSIFRPEPNEWATLSNALDARLRSFHRQQAL